MEFPTRYRISEGQKYRPQRLLWVGGAIVLLFLVFLISTWFIRGNTLANFLPNRVTPTELIPGSIDSSGAKITPYYAFAMINTSTQTPTKELTNTATRTLSPTNTATNTQTQTPTASETPTVTPTNTNTLPYWYYWTSTKTNTQTPTRTKSPTLIPSEIPTDDTTPTETATSTPLTPTPTSTEP